MATETTYLSGQGLTITRSQRDPDGPVWWWVRDSKPTSNKTESATYQQRETLKGAGARWSRKRRAWYLITPELPDSIQQLVAPDVEAASPAPSTPAATAPLVVNEGFVAVEGGKRLYHTTVHDLARHGLATVLNEDQLNRVYELPGGHLFGGNAFQGVIYHELRRVTEDERETQALREARSQVALYTAWSANLERLSQHLAIPALPAPQAGQPSVQVLPDLADPWN